jgi:MoaA/NifB/PqqE/SkfB family radical SAM enzyme
MKQPVPVNFIKRSLWAERHNPAVQYDGNAPCERTHLFDQVCYIWTNGDVGLCGYDDRQQDLICGNVYEDSIADIWQSDARKELIEKVRTRQIKGYPCVNPKLCLFY